MTTEELIARFGNPVYKDCGDGWCVPHFPWAEEMLEQVWCANGVYVFAHTYCASKLSNVLWCCWFTHKWSPKFAMGWATRHKMLDPTRGLSMHAFGFAIDIDPDDNKVGTKGVIPPEVVKEFKAAGFDWGGEWNTPDPMHFEWRIP